MGGLIKCCRKPNFKKIHGLNQLLIEEKKNIYSSSRDGQKKEREHTGQDSYDIITTELGENIKFLAVYDGHGIKGKEASHLAREEIRKQLIRDKSILSNLYDRNQADNYFKKLFYEIEIKFNKFTKEYELSGTCVIGVLIVESHCFIINLGDSRAVIGAKQGDNKVAYQMSIDHKANRDDERKRIEESGGLVTSERNGNIGIPRIYSKSEDRPGLAISRSLGDIYGHTIGITSEPEVSYKELDENDKFLVIGSDGIWDVMNSSEVIGFIFNKSDSGRERIADDIIDECRTRWEVVNMYSQKIENEKFLNANFNSNSNSKKKMIIDDITAVICFFNTD